MACTTILVGKNASYDGSTLVARNEDSPSGQFTPKKLTVVHPEDQPRIYKSVLSKVEISLPDNPMRYTALPNALNNEGIWAACGINEANVSMNATETLTSNELVLGADPLVKYQPAQSTPGDPDYIPEQIGGIGEEDMVTLVLPYIKSAREGVIRLGELLTTYGTYEMNGIAFQDVEEIWWLETIGGHHFMAKRVPDDAYVVMPNQLGIDSFDFEDAMSAQKEHICSSDLLEFVKKNHLDLSLGGSFNPRLAFGSHSDSDHTYNTPRTWIVQRHLNPNSNIWDGIDADYRPDSDDIPWSRLPEYKITPEEIKYLLSHHYQGTDFDPYNKHAKSELKGSFRAIGINRNNVLAMTQIRPDLPSAIAAVKWVAFSSNPFNAVVPLYGNVLTMPDYFANTGAEVSTDNFYWNNRLIAAMADAAHPHSASSIERYQLKVQTEARQLLNHYDQLLLKEIENHSSITTIHRLTAEANQKIAEMVKLHTAKLLDEILYISSCQMRNSFARSDA